MKKYMAAVALLVLSFQIKAQDVEAGTINNGHHIGLYAGASSGYGLSYRYFKDKIGLQVTTTPIFATNETHFSVGGQFLGSFSRTKYTNFYGYVGYHYNYNRYLDEWDSNATEEVNITSITGLGIGFELTAGNRVGFNWQVGYALYYFDKDDWQTMLDGAIGVYYKF